MQMEVRNESPKLVACQGKHKHEFGFEAYAESERRFAPELGHCYNTTWISWASATFHCTKPAGRVRLAAAID
jgi:hypothetical protein